jgi:ribosomal protein S18 acetylase RimI-like enzyme
MIRERTENDIPDCVRALREVHELDGYPAVWPSDPARWISSVSSAAWVDADDSGVHGHLAARLGTSVTWPSAPQRGVWVARFFVEPAHRNRGVGVSLLDRAVDLAQDYQVDAMLEVTSTGEDAIGLYESHGWSRTGERVADWTDANRRHPVLYLYTRKLAA